MTPTTANENATPGSVQRMVRPRTFEHFPPTSVCPVCNTSEDGECLLLEIDGTRMESICEGKPVHLWCAVAKRFNPEYRIIYTKV